MIIVVSSDSSEISELMTITQYIQTKDPRHIVVLPFNELNEKRLFPLDNHDELIILGHGYVEELAGFTPKALAKPIAELINRRYANEHFSIKKITFSACNTGKCDDSGHSFAEIFSHFLSKYITLQTTIEIVAPTGILVYYPNGESMVLVAQCPNLSLSAYLNTIKSIDSSSSSAQEKLAPFLKKNTPFVRYGAVDSRLLDNKAYKLKVLSEDEEKEEEMSKLVPATIKKYAGTLFLNNSTYNWFTERYAERESATPSPTSLPNW